VTQAEYARQRGVSRQAINDLVVRGILRLHDGKIDVAEADAACQQFLDPAKSQILTALPAQPVQPDAEESLEPPEGASDGEAISYHAARTMREKFNALSAQAEYLKLLDTLTSTAAVRDEIFSVMRTFRDNLALIGPRIAQRLASEGDPLRCQLLIDEQHEALLNELSRAFALDAAGGIGERAPASP